MHTVPMPDSQGEFAEFKVQHEVPCRNHRIGQQRRPVYITLRCQDSIDERIARALDAKGSALAEFQARVEEYKRQGLRKSVADLVRAL